MGFLCDLFPSIRRKGYDSQSVKNFWPRLGELRERSVNVMTKTLIPWGNCRARVSKRSPINIDVALAPCALLSTTLGSHLQRYLNILGLAYVLRQHDHSFMSLPFLKALSSFSALQVQCHVSNLRPCNLVLMAHFVVLGILCLQLRPVSAVSCKLGQLVRAYSHRVAPFLLHLLSFTRYQVG